MCVQKRHQTHLGEGQGRASWKNDLVLQDEAQGRIRILIIQLWAGETEQAKAWRLSMSSSTHVATTWATATGNEAREGGGDTTMRSLTCQAEELGTDAKGAMQGLEQRKDTELVYSRRRKMKPE